jgi:hypothetical protein
MKKVTKKMVGEFLAETKGECNWCVFSFDKKTGVRDMAYGGYEFMSAFAVMTTQLAKGLDVILTNKDGWEFSNNYEWTNHKRVTYDQMKDYQIKVAEYSFEVGKAKKY